MKYEPVIGLEIHIELATKSKMFCSCSADYFTADPNTHTCPVCLGLPGAMPKANIEAIKMAQYFGLALNCQLQLSSKFDRKNYFYPDLAKGFQVSQYDLPFSQKGFIEISMSGQKKKIGVTRAHLEEDTGKLIHTKVGKKDVTLIDFNRSSVPLIEIVSEPDMNTSEEAKLYAQKIQQIARYLEASDADMEKGSMRIEPNVSLRKKGEKGLPSYKVELKNINSFKFAQKAIDFEIKRQSGFLDKGEAPIQETRGWNESKSETVSQRSKEAAHDYRYFPEPDLPPFTFESAYIQNLNNSLPELPDSKKERLQKEYNLSTYDSSVIAQDKNLADFFEETAKAYKKDTKKVANWITGELLRRFSELNITVNETKILPAQLAELLLAIDEGKLTQTTAKEALKIAVETGNSPAKIISESGASVISENEIAEVIENVLRENNKAVQDYIRGKEASLSFLIGQVQKATEGKANPQMAREKIIEKIKTTPD